MKKTYMLDTNICSFIMREHPLSVIKQLQKKVAQRHSIVISAITYSELRFGAIGKKVSPKHNMIVDEFIDRLDDIIPWDRHAVDCSAKVKKQLSGAGTLIGNNDTLIAGHAISTQSILVTNNSREFSRVEGVVVEDWV